MYRICKRFEFSAAHVLAKHSGRCRFVHGHNYRVDVTIVADVLDDNDMVCDFQAVKAIVVECIDNLDHAILLNSADGASCAANAENPKKVVLDDLDPTSEVIAKTIFDRVAQHLVEGAAVKSAGPSRQLNPSARLEKVRVWETPSAWAEYQR